MKFHKLCSARFLRHITINIIFQHPLFAPFQYSFWKKMRPVPNPSLSPCFGIRNKKVRTPRPSAPSPLPLFFLLRPEFLFSASRRKLSNLEALPKFGPSRFLPVLFCSALPITRRSDRCFHFLQLIQIRYRSLLDMDQAFQDSIQRPRDYILFYKVHWLF